MKTDRLIGILSILLQRDMVTAPYLAERFEVSRRTINRDIESLCRAGIPITTKQGTNGGISIMDGYKIDRTVLTTTEMQDILAGLRGLDSINGTNRYGQLMEKLLIGASDFMSANQSILIDLSSWYKDFLAPKIELFRNAINTCTEVNFIYYSSNGESIRTIEPYFLIFRWSSWYVWGWCKTRDDYRLFKLNRMTDLKTVNLFHKRSSVPLPNLKDERIFPGGIKVKALFNPNCKWRLIEEFGIDCFKEQPDGKLLFHADYTNKENLITWLMTFRNQVTLLEPEDIRKELYLSLKSTITLYETQGEK